MARYLTTNAPYQQLTRYLFILFIFSLFFSYFFVNGQADVYLCNNCLHMWHYFVLTYI